MKVKRAGGSIARLDDGIFLIPGGKSGGSNVFVLKGKRKIALIDTGMPQDHEFICSCRAEIGVGIDDIGIVILTHEHIDHVGGLRNLPAHVVVAAHGRAANKLQLDDDFSMMAGAFNVEKSAIHVDIHLQDGSLLDLGGIRLRVVYAPGHCSGAICLYEPERGAIFTGDTIFAGGVLGGIFASGNISDYINSLERLREFRLASMYPGHGRMSANPAADMDRAIKGSAMLMSDTRNLFEAINVKGSFDRIKQGAVDYSRRAAEQRRHGRVPSVLNALLHLADADYPVSVHDISMAGARLDREIAVARGETVRMTLDAIGELGCEVVAHIGGHTRLRFVDAAPDHPQLAAWLRENRKGAKPSH